MKYLIIALLFILNGCSTLPQAVTTIEKVNDVKLAGYEKGLCNGASSGAVMRRYGLNSQKAIARRVLCGYTSGSGVAR